MRLQIPYGQWESFVPAQDKLRRNRVRDIYVDLAGTKVLKSTFSALVRYEHRFTEKLGIDIGTDLFFDNRFVVKIQFGTYLSDNRGKGNFFMRPALRYHFSKRFFAQIGLKTLDRGAADYLETGIGWKPFVR